MNTIKIYRIGFADGAAYVGQTRLPLARRLYKHKLEPVNRSLCERLVLGEEYELRVLSRHRKQANADAAELAAIKKERKPLNRRGVDLGKHKSGAPPINPNRTRMFATRRPRAPRIKPRSTEPAVCTLCRRRLPAEEFHADRSRFNGLNSRCRECHTSIHAAISIARREGNAAAVSAAYYKKKAECQARRESP